MHRTSATLMGAMAITLVLTTSCATYQPAPLDVHELAAERRQSSFDPDAVETVLAEIAPGIVWDRVAWNDLTLFAAALTKNPEAATARSALLATEAAARASSVAPGPSVSLTTEYALNAPESSPWLVGVLGDTLLDVGGVRQARVQSAGLTVRQAQLDYGQAIWQIRMSLRRALLAWRSNIRTVEGLSELLRFRELQFESTARRVEAGEIPRADLERVRGDVAAARAAQLTARGVSERSLIDLAATIGVEPDALTTAVIEPTIPIDALPSTIPENALDAAIANRSEILKAITDYERAETDYRGVVAAQYPSVHIGAGYIWERGLKKIPGALTLSLPSWDLNASAIQAAQASRADAGARLELTVARVVADVRVAQADYLASRAAVAVAEEETVTVAARLAEQADRELAVGWTNRTDWAAAQAGLAQARLDLIAAQTRARAAFLTLEEAMQMPLAGPEVEIGIGRVETTP